MRFIRATPQTLDKQVQEAIIAGHKIVAVSSVRPDGSITITTIPPAPLEEMEIEE